MRAELGLIHKQIGVTTIYVTHDQVEAMTLGQRVAVMRSGELQQVAAPQELYSRPNNLFVAGFIGSPAMNFFEGTIVRLDGGLGVTFGAGQELGIEPVEAGAPLEGFVDRKAIVGVRPEHLEDAARAGDTPAARRFKGLVQLRELLGAETVVHFQVDATPAVTDAIREIAADVDAATLTELDHQRQARRASFVGRFHADTTVREDAPAEIAVAPGALRFFDPETGDRIGA
jgi:multiple sugar transport system ATP-binding protein